MDDIRQIERHLRNLKLMAEGIEAMLDASLGGQQTSSMILKFLDQVAALPVDTHEDVLTELSDAGKLYMVRLGELEKAAAAGGGGEVNGPTITFNTFEAEGPKQMKEKPVTHDGEIETFRAFWIMFKGSVKDVDDKKEKHRRLCHAVAPADRNRIVGLKWKGAKAFLKKKYTSAQAVREYIEAKLGRIRVRHADDADGLKELKEATATALLVAQQQKDEEVLAEMFDLVYSRLPRDLQRLLMKQAKAKKKADRVHLLESFFEDEVDALVAHNLSNKTQLRARQEKKPAAGKGNKVNEDSRKCYYCHKVGHIASNCAELASAKCAVCGEVGHTKKFCNSKSGNKASSKYPASRYSKGVDGPKRSDAASWRKQVAAIEQPQAEPDQKPRCVVTVGEASADGFVDTGSDKTHLPDTIVKTDAPVRTFTMADGKSVFCTKGPVDVVFTVAGVTFTHPVYVIKGSEAIIGSDLLDKYGGLIDYADGRSLKFTKPPVQVENVEMKENTGEPLKKEEVAPAKPLSPTEVEKVVEEEYNDLMEGLGKTDLIEHVIDTGDHKPIAVRGRRIPAHYMDAVAEHVKALLGQDIVEESNSEWLFPLVIVKKKDGDIRMANDLRKLNEICKKDSYPMPRVDEFFERIGQAKVFSRVDLRKGYYQIMLRKEDREKTAFAFKGKLYHFKRMPFGSSNAPQTFQRLMTRILGDLSFVVIYLDDILIFSDDEVQHMDHLRQVLDRIRGANLRLNKEKCEFGRDEIEFLGFRIKDGKKTPNDEKTEILANFPVPTTPRLLKGFLGLANFFRNLIPDFAELARPLFEASNNKKLVWTDECEAKFKALKEKLANSPSTYLPNLNVPLIVTSDVETGGGRPGPQAGLAHRPAWPVQAPMGQAGPGLKIWEPTGRRPGRAWIWT